MFIAAIDPGAKGAIAVKNTNTNNIVTFDMPQDLNALKPYLLPNTKVYIEKVNFWGFNRERKGVGSNNAFEGKVMNLQKLFANYNQIIGLCLGLDLEVKEIHPATWQKFYKYELAQFEGKTKKHKLKEVAKKHFPDLKPKLSNCDAMLILKAALEKWI